MKTSGAVVLVVSLAAAARAAPVAEEKSAATGRLIGEKDRSTCKKFAPGKRTVRTNLKPETELGDLIAWISSITCKQFLLPGTIPASKKVTVVAPELITPQEAYRLFLGALDSTGLTIEHTGKFERIVETATIKTMGGIPVHAEGSDVPGGYHYVTRMIRRRPPTPGEPPIDIHDGPFPPPGTYDIVTEMERVIGEKDARGCKPSPPGTPGIKLNLKPRTKVTDLIAWIASVTCKWFTVTDTLGADFKKVTVVAPERITPEEAYALFQEALDSVGLTVEGSGDVRRVVEAPDAEAYVTRLMRVEYVDPNEVVQIMERIKSERGKVVLIKSTGGIVVTDLPENVNRMLRALVQY